MPRTNIRIFLLVSALVCLTPAVLSGRAAGRQFAPPPGVEYLSSVVFGTGGGRPLRMEILLRPDRPARLLQEFKVRARLSIRQVWTSNPPNSTRR